MDTSLLCHEELFTPSPRPCSTSPFLSEDWEFSVLPSNCNAVGGEEFSHVFQNYLQREHRYTAVHGYVDRLRASGGLSDARFRCVQWMLLAGIRLGLRHKTAFAAVNYLDRFLSASRCSRNWETWMVQLISIACLSIASKFEQVCHPTFDEYQIKDLKLDRKFDPSTIKQMELLVLKVLDWQLNCVTSYSYLELLGSHLSPSSMARITDQLIDTLLGIDYFLDQLHAFIDITRTAKSFFCLFTDFTFLEHSPVVVAVSVLRYAAEGIAPMRLDISFTPFEALISEELKAKINVCSKIVEDHNAQK